MLSTEEREDVEAPPVPNAERERADQLVAAVRDLNGEHAVLVESPATR